MARADRGDGRLQFGNGSRAQEASHCRGIGRGSGSMGLARVMAMEQFPQHLFGAERQARLSGIHCVLRGGDAHCLGGAALNDGALEQIGRRRCGH